MLIKQPRRAQRACWAPLAISVVAVALSACGVSPSAEGSERPPDSSPTPAARPSRQSPAASPATTAPATAQVARRIDGIVYAAKATYRNETTGPKLFQELRRIARDGILLEALSRNDRAGAQAEADAQLRSHINHLAHVTRISVVRGSRVLVNATVNSDGAFVVAPGSRTLHLHGRTLGTLLVSLQDVTGFVKLVHRRTGAEVLVRGASGHVRTSLSAAAGVRLPSSGQVTISGRRYFARSFRETGWGAERLTAWILEGA
jgi:hypothetical protein